MCRRQALVSILLGLPVVCEVGSGMQFVSHSTAVEDRQLLYDPGSWPWHEGRLLLYDGESRW